MQGGLAGDYAAPCAIAFLAPGNGFANDVAAMTAVPSSEVDFIGSN